MAKTSNFIPARGMNPIGSPFKPEPKTATFECKRNSRISVSSASKKKEFSTITRKNPRSPRRLITIATSDGKWHRKWTLDYVFSLEELQLEDLAEDGDKDAEVSITLSIEKHASFGLSVGGRIIASFTRKCSNCTSLYCREINTSFDVWVLPSSKDNRRSQIPEIGGDDPSVIYVKPGSEADLDSLIQDTIRLNTSVKETCSEYCEKSEPRLQYIGEKNTSVDGRWSRLLELRNANLTKNRTSK